MYDVSTSTVNTSNKYNANRIRIERAEDDETTRFYYTGSSLLYSTNEEHVLQTENILDINGNVIASKRFKARAKLKLIPMQTSITSITMMRGAA